MGIPELLQLSCHTSRASLTLTIKLCHIVFAITEFYTIAILLYYNLKEKSKKH